jgi:RNA polymerase sigma factor (sigma-70 family)
VLLNRITQKSSFNLFVYRPTRQLAIEVIQFLALAVYLVRNQINLRKMTYTNLPMNDKNHMVQVKIWNTYLTRVGKTQDKEAFAALFHHFSPLLKSFLLKTGNLNADSAEELVQETMIKVWQRAPSFSAARASASTWIYTIARNTRIDSFRKQQRQDPNAVCADDIYEDQTKESPYADLLQVRRKVDVGQLLLELPQEQSDVLKMMYFRGLSGQQVAQALDLPLGTVKSRIRLALAKLKIGLAPNYEADHALQGKYNGE